MFFSLQGGSFGRGTDLRGGCDAELVIFLNCFKDYKDQGARRGQILEEIRAQLESWWQDRVPSLSLKFPEQSAPGALQLQLASAALESRVDVSLLPAFDAIGEGAQPAPWRAVFKDDLCVCVCLFCFAFLFGSFLDFLSVHSILQCLICLHMLSFSLHC